MENRTKSNSETKSNQSKPKIDVEKIYSYFDSKKSSKEIQHEFNLSKSTVSYHKKNWEENRTTQNKLYAKQKAMALVEKLEAKTPDEIIKVLDEKERKKLDDLDIDTLLDMLEKRMTITAIKSAKYLEKHIDKETIDTKEIVAYLRGYS